NRGLLPLRFCLCSAPHAGPEPIPIRNSPEDRGPAARDAARLWSMGLCGRDRDYGGSPRLAGRTAGRPLSRRGAILVLVAASGARLLLEAAAHRLADWTDHQGPRRQRVRDPAVRPPAACD